MKLVPLSVFFRQNIVLLAIFCLALCIMSCSSPNKTKAPLKKTIVTKPIKQTKTITAADLLTQAKQADAITANDLSIKASKQYLTEQAFKKALWLSTQLLTIEQTQQQAYQLNLVAAQASYALKATELAEKYIQHCQDLALEYAIQPPLNYYQLTQKMANDKNNVVDNIYSQLHAFALNTEATEVDTQTIWQALIKLPQWQQAQLEHLSPPFINGWLALLQTANQFGGTLKLVKEVNVWQQEYASHPANFIANDLLNHAHTPQNSYQNIAVILPLTGKQQLAGQSAQEGILAALNQSSSVRINFLDASTLDFSTLNKKINEQNYDVIIGPLLKENVEKYLAIKEISIPTLLLNMPENTKLQAQQYILSMRPEDEAIQAASTLSQKDYQQPVVFVHRDKTSQRMSKAFIETWQKATNRTPITVPFEQGQAMQNILKETLDIEQSQQRIKTLRKRVREVLKVESRNRRDIDMIYIIGNPLQTRLLKPYIDVNTATFADIIPVFASSKSHSIKNDDSTINDLRNLTFTQIPFLLTSKQQNQVLAHDSNTLWPKRNDSLHRIFSMGFDAFSLINKLESMKRHPFIRHYGQTGTLKLSENNILTRSLLWGTYKRNKVVEVNME